MIKTGKKLQLATHADKVKFTVANFYRGAVNVQI